MQNLTNLVNLIYMEGKFIDLFDLVLPVVLSFKYLLRMNSHVTSWSLISGYFSLVFKYMTLICITSSNEIIMTFVLHLVMRSS